MKKVIVLEAAISEDGKTLLFPDRYTRIDRPDLYSTYEVIEGKATRVIIVSDDRLDRVECRRLAIAYMTGRFVQYSFDLSKDNPKWEVTKWPER